MAIDFPASPTNGQTFTSGSVTYTFDGTKWTAVAAGGGGATDKIEEGNTSAEVIDTGSDGRFVVTTEGSERLRVASDGKVGVNTTSPQGLLQVDGVTGNAPVRILGSSGNSSALALYNNAATTNRFVIGQGFGSGSDNVAFIQNDANAALAFGTNAAERARIDSSGRLLVGTSTARTVSFWDTPRHQFEGLGYQAAGMLLYGNENGIYGANLSLGKSRGTSIGSDTIVQSGDYLGTISFLGSDGSNEIRGAEISAFVDGTPGANDMPGRLVFSTTADGASSPTERFRLQANGLILTGSLYNRTTAAAANVYVDSGTDLYRSTSSIKYKTDVETLQDAYADAILNVRPVWYHSTCDGDCKEHSWWGFIAEEVAEIDPRLVHWKTKEITYDENGLIVPVPCDPEPEGVAYDRFVPHLLNLIKRQGEAIAELQAEVAALKGA
jgi:hypothetical protein